MPKSKARKASACEHLDPSYEPEDDEDDDEDTEQGVVDNVSNDAPSLGSTRNVRSCHGGPGASKRVMAPDEQDHLAKRTRHKTRELSTIDKSCHSSHDDLFTANGSAEPEPENQIQIDNEGKDLIYCLSCNMICTLEKCAKNKSNREKVVMQQRTGSRCFVAHCHAVKQDKYKDVPATPIDLFKECYCSSKIGFTDPVKKAIADMEAMMTEPPEGQDPKSPNEIFSEVLPRSKFLQTAGIVAATPKRNGKAAVSSRVQELESELEAEKRGAEALGDQLDAQQLEMVDLKKCVQDSDAQIEALKQQAAETNIILRKLLMLNKV
ncbi:hypothetical protein EJB05_37510 [Eragrostis curvula]|uniref:Uncharacterized protein n=1 Tax=Eragrostis curvula TaxID=38414 RepID=A0A5J9TRT6_9POAL|nr:hypothetical protein EJB05_37510 [Eragrostis curvula]